VSAVSAVNAVTGWRRTRLLTGAAALIVGLVLATAPLSAGRPLAGLQVVAGLAGVITLLVGLAGWPAGIGLSVAALATAYTLGVAGRVGADPTAPVEAAGLVLMAELAVWSLEARSLAPDSRDVLAWRLRRLAVIVGGTITLGAVVVAVADLPAHSGAPLGAVGVASAVAVLTLAALGLYRAIASKR
jgi:hypothetical protein